MRSTIRDRYKYVINRYEVVERSNSNFVNVWIVDTPISKKVYAHDPTLPKSPRTDSNPTIVVTNRNRIRLEKLRIEDQYDYEIKIDAADMLPQTWKHAGLPPDGMFTPKFQHNPHHKFKDRYSDFGGFGILAMAACNLVMSDVALSDNGTVPAEIKPCLMPGIPLRHYTGPVNAEPPIITMSLWNELDERRMVYALGMLVRLFYRDEGEKGDRDLREQELRKAVIMYMAGTGGASQFANFTSLCMAMELAADFAKSVGIRPDDNIHKAVASLQSATMRGGGATPAKPKSHLGKVCRSILGDGVVRRVEEYPYLNNRLKHYGSDKGIEYFNGEVDKITEIMRRLRADASYVILLGLMKLYGIEGVPAREDENRRTSSVVRGMVEDCVDRHGAGESDGGIEEKIRRLEEMVENEAVKNKWDGCSAARAMLHAFKMLAKAADMLDTPDGADGMRALVRECEDVLLDELKPSRYELASKYTDVAMYAWLVNIAHKVVMRMDGKFGVAQEGGTSGGMFGQGAF